MQDNTSAFYKRVGALGAATALAVSGAFIASPAIASPTGEPDVASTEAPVTTATEAPASEPAVDETVTDEEAAPEEAAADDAEASEEAGALPPGLAEALLRDLGMTVEEFEAAGELGKKAADALPELQATEGFVGIAIEDEKIVITGSGEALEALAIELDATLVAPAEAEVAEPTEAPTEEATDAPSAEATEEAAVKEAPAKVSLPGNYREAIAALSSDYIANVGVQGLQSIMWNGAGYVINVDKAATLGNSVLAKNLADVAGSPADAVAAKYNNVIVVDAPAGTPTAVEDVVNGQGYVSFTSPTEGYLCSIGFNGFNASGDPAVITAGHCSQDGNVTDAQLTVPSDDEAAGGTQTSIGNDLGTWGFSQFGGPGHAPITEIPETYDPANPPAGTGTDIAVIDKINEDLDLLPEVTEWKDGEDLTADTVRLTGTSDAVVGAEICKSGRTTGWSCGTVTGLGWFPVGGHNMGTNPDDLRGVIGFESTMVGNAAPGDSGGPTISGSLAVGINSAITTRGADEIMFSTSLSDGLSYLKGYSVAVFVDAPKLTSHEDKGTVLTGETISGTTTGTSIKLTRNGETKDLKVTDGQWSFEAPYTLPEGGKLEFKVQAVNGFNKSKTASYELTVKEAPLAAPVITNPAADAQIADSLTTITGTGAVDAKVSLELKGNNTAKESDTADAAAAVSETGTATVAADGTWEWKLDEALSYGEYTVTAKQDLEGKETSDTVTSKFSVILEKAVINGIEEGQDFTEGQNPTDISGTGTAEAEVTLTLTDTATGSAIGEAIAAQVDGDGSWTAEGLPTLAPGAFSVTAVQNLSGAVSDPSVVNFTVTAVEITPEAPPVAPSPTPAPQPGDPTPTPAPAPDKDGDGLADTGAAGMGLFAGAGALLTAGGISALLINRRRQMQDA